MSKHYRKEHNCLNCGANVKGKFCGQCGQENLELHEPFWHFLVHSIGHYFHFDSKFFHTIKPLITKPGQLTLDYVSGKRTRFLQPVSMYIFVSIIYFLVISIVNHKKEANRINPNTKATYSNKDKSKYIKSLNDFKKLSFDRQTIVLDSLKKSKNPSIYILELFEEEHIAREDSTYQSYLKRQNGLPSSEQDNFISRFLTEKSYKISPKGNKNLDLSTLSEKYKSKVYFIMMPLFAWFLMLNFRKNNKYYIDHLIFTLHLFTAFFLFEIVAEPLNYLIGYLIDKDLISSITFIIVLVYIFKAIKRFYQRSSWTIIRKMFTLSIMLFISFLLGELLVGTVALLVA